MARRNGECSRGGGTQVEMKKSVERIIALRMNRRRNKQNENEKYMGSETGRSDPVDRTVVLFAGEQSAGTDTHIWGKQQHQRLDELPRASVGGFSVRAGQLRVGRR